MSELREPQMADCEGGMMTRAITRTDNAIRANEVRKALTASATGNSGLNVFAMNSKMEWQRITNVKTHREYVYGMSLNSGKWFVIHQWREQ